MRNRLPLALAFACLGFAGSAMAQATKPMSEAELLKTIDQLGTGDPLTKNPLGAPDSAATPKPKKAKDSDDRSKDGETEITADEGAFDNKTHQAVFTKKVFVKNPDFTVSCDKLTAYMKHEEPKAGANTAGTGKATPAASPKSTPRLSTSPASGVEAELPAGGSGKAAGKGQPDEKAGGLERAIAEGNVVIVQDKVDADGNISHNIGHGKKAVYEADTGLITLTGKPEVQQGINSCVALDEGSIIIMNRDGKMKTIGPTKTVIKEAQDTNNPKTANGR